MPYGAASPKPVTVPQSRLSCGAQTIMTCAACVTPSEVPQGTNKISERTIIAAVMLSDRDHGARFLPKRDQMT